MKLSQPLKIIITFILITLLAIFGTVNDVIEPDPIVEEPKVAKTVDPKQLACMAKNIFYEAGNESINGQAAVARVVMNRIAS